MTELSDALLRWFDLRKRDLPWRASRDPYRIWVSEIMLQQTRVETVILPYVSFLEQFPTVEALAAADDDAVLASWQGLGYYRRARSLLQAARQLGADSRPIPADAVALQRLPGIGVYTAAAIASIAFDEQVPVLDGNVERVLTRWTGNGGDPKTRSVRAALRETARTLLAPARPGDSNQAMMELGATVCTPRAPRCDECPLAPRCVALREGRPEAYPLPRRRRDVEAEVWVAALVTRGGKTLLVRRSSAEDLMPGLWEVPWARLAEGSPPEEALARRYGGAWRLGETVRRARHTITHRRIDVDVRRGELGDVGSVAESEEAGWFEPRDLESLPQSSLLNKCLGRAR